MFVRLIEDVEKENRILVNTDNICTLRQLGEKKCMVDLVNGHRLIIRESVEEVLVKINANI